MGTHIFPGRGQCLQVPLPEAPYKVDGFLAAVFERHTSVRSLTVPSNSSRTTSTVRGLPQPSFRVWTIGLWYGLILYDVLLRVLVFLEFVFWPFLSYTNAPGLFGGRGEMAMAVHCCHSFFRHSMCVRADLAALYR